MGSLFLFAPDTVKHLAIPDFEFRRFPGETRVFFLKFTFFKCYYSELNWKFRQFLSEMPSIKVQNRSLNTTPFALKLNFFSCSIIYPQSFLVELVEKNQLKPRGLHLNICFGLWFQWKIKRYCTIFTQK